VDVNFHSPIRLHNVPLCLFDIRVYHGLVITPVTFIIQQLGFVFAVGSQHIGLLLLRNRLSSRTTRQTGVSAVVANIQN
jgi:hypothetical protein